MINLNVKKEKVNVKRAEIYLANLSTNTGERNSIQSGRRPVLVISNEKCNQYSPVITIIPISSKMTKAKLPTHISLSSESGLQQNSVLLGEQIMTISKENLEFKIGEVPQYKMEQVEKAIKIQTSLLGYIDLKIIEEKVFAIKKLKELYNMTKNQDLLRMFKSSLEDLKRYCNDFGKSSLLYYNDTIETNNTKVACAI